MNIGGADGTQTHDLYDANVALYQLSYNPKTGADKKTRTSKVLLPLVPETSASTNSAISAVTGILYQIHAICNKKNLYGENIFFHGGVWVLIIRLH